MNINGVNHTGITLNSTTASKVEAKKNATDHFNILMRILTISTCKVTKNRVKSQIYLFYFVGMVLGDAKKTTVKYFA